jgi:hypothetical protein
MTFTTGQTIRIRRTLLDSSVNFEDSLARFERYGPSGMVYATREDGSDSVAFAEECFPSSHVAVIRARAVAPEARPVPGTFNFRNHAHTKRDVAGYSYIQLADMAGITVSVLKKMISAGKLKSERIGPRRAAVAFDEAKRWLESRKGKEA